MNASSMEPFGLALTAYAEGQTSAELTVIRDDGFETHLPASHFFRKPSELELMAIDRCVGTVLDSGAGTGVHSLILQEGGFSVTSVDICEHAVNVMRQRGIAKAKCADVLHLQGPLFNTMLMLGHGIGIVETIDGLDRFLLHARNLVAEDGQILLDSLDVSVSKDPQNIAYQEANRLEGRYIGETRIQFEFEARRGPFCGWLHVDSGSLAEHADLFGWKTEVLFRNQAGEYLARLTNYI